MHGVLETFPALQDRLDESASRLSGGQQQMLAIGQALMSSPRVLLIDEPSSGLSPRPVAEVFRALRVLADSGVAVVVVEQQVDGIAGVSDRIVVIDSGRVAWSGPATDPALYEMTRDIYFGTAETAETTVEGDGIQADAKTE
jgi:branched-chain amino acid transport system ATP-binding protein